MFVWPVQHAKARFGELLDACLREGPQVVSRRGTETGVLVPIEQWRRLQAAARPSLKQLLLARGGAVGHGLSARHQRGGRTAPAAPSWSRARLAGEH
ncbi:MAG: type II toxin-antitoxin system Phd/YefM family antitoxin [Cyanobacteria bacterium K_Offshore_surface_m2_239]|nr:type II toxin-antitoxin system Phd/YefM family antitoxin [Cyanobacteria bacterium K_Offshore_surface_m2_239]